MSGDASAIWASAREAASFVEDGTIVGLGTGRAAAMFVRALAERARSGLSVRTVPTSIRTEELARELGLPLVSLGEIDGIDLDVDGADEVAPDLSLIKGHGGALLRERVVASLSRRFVILVGQEKLVSRLGERVAVPVETAAFALPVVGRRLAELGATCRIREAGGTMFLSDNGNPIVDARFERIDQPAELERRIDAIPGVVDCGLFVGMADLVLVQSESGFREIARPSSPASVG